jgi:hypothetical protein
LTALNWVKSKPISNLSLILGIDLRGHSLTDLTGHVAIRDASFLSAKESFRMDSLIFTSNLNRQQRRYSLQSDWIQGEVTGQFNPETLAASLNNIACRYLPAVFSGRRLVKPDLNNDIEWAFTLYPVPPVLNQVVDFPVYYEKPIKITGFLHDATSQFKLRIDAPELEYSHRYIEQATFLLENPNPEAKLILHAIVGDEEPVTWDMDIRSMANLSTVRLFWSNNGMETNAGTIACSVLFQPNAIGKPIIQASIQPSELVWHDSAWQLSPTRLEWESGRLLIEQFQLKQQDQYIQAHGTVSSNLSDTLQVELHNFKSELLARLMPKNMLFGGTISGKVACPHLLNKGTMDAALAARDFSINKQLWEI